MLLWFAGWFEFNVHGFIAYVYKDFQQWYCFYKQDAFILFETLVGYFLDTFPVSFAHTFVGLLRYYIQVWRLRIWSYKLLHRADGILIQ